MEVELIKITWNTKDNGVDFGIPALGDNIIKKHNDEVREMLLTLVDRLDNAEYPFSYLKEKD